ncbi:MAG TPA: SemiSWEET transporter [Candidatus Bilamarchaeaceae archaeon]|nr:SemiSWEET transporter [Candidatus Bilamarchaeaceae archaeon]
MPTESVTLLGYAAGTLTTIAFVPQVLKAWQSKSTRDISLSMTLILTTGIVLWFLYGLSINSLPIIFANAISFMLVLALLILKLKYQ